MHATETRWPELDFKIFSICKHNAEQFLLNSFGISAVRRRKSHENLCPWHYFEFGENYTYFSVPAIINIFWRKRRHHCFLSYARNAAECNLWKKHWIWNSYVSIGLPQWSLNGPGNHDKLFGDNNFLTIQHAIGRRRWNINTMWGFRLAIFGKRIKRGHIQNICHAFSKIWTIWFFTSAI